MNKTVTGIIIAILAIGGVVFAVTRNSQTSNSPSTNLTSNQSNSDMDTANQNTADTNQSADPLEGETDVAIRNQAYSPEAITIKVGTKVTWTNEDSMEHDVMPDEDYGDAFEASELLGRDESYSFTFNKPGTYTYHCTPHPFMKGTIRVVE